MNWLRIRTFSPFLKAQEDVSGAILALLWTVLQWLQNSFCPWSTSSIKGFYNLIHPITMFSLSPDPLPLAGKKKKSRIKDRLPGQKVGSQLGKGVKVTFWEHHISNTWKESSLQAF